MFRIGRRPDDESSGWFADDTGRYSERWRGERGVPSGHVNLQLWDHMFGRNPEARFYFQGDTGALSVVGERVVVMTNKCQHRGSTLVVAPVAACTMDLLPAGALVKLRVVVETGIGESPTAAATVVELLYPRERERELTGFVDALYPDRPKRRRQVRPMVERGNVPPVAPPPMPQMREPVREQVKEAVPPPVGHDAPLVVDAVPAEKPSPSSLPRLRVRTAPEGGDWLCFRPSPETAEIIDMVQPSEAAEP
ncbi:hypothetical protein FXN61_20675 [Lentzea sp. PSKA42]|uniref:Uncharacterized protein n=1 Tax=Lentzea indica TaxID=2604800 RepID=A0ABX1FJD4_9PSEU|nr:hypothetical protein [Lentzea indica]NKE59094.1 hypothetical protein [Lentzea indica]